MRRRRRLPSGEAHSRVANAYASLTSESLYPDPQDGRAAVTGKFDPAVVDAFSQVDAELWFLAATNQQEIAPEWFPDQRP
ncbi:MAG: hypothetical protein VXY98_03110 [Pseudomonadota bacterium]|nr:hypothetical protein [Pseudomonadota bacterium]